LKEIFPEDVVIEQCYVDAAINGIIRVGGRLKMRKKLLLIITILFTVMLTIVACSNNSPQEPEKQIVKLEAPTNVRIEGGVLKWDSVENAIAYVVKVGDARFFSAHLDTFLELNYLPLPVGTHSVSVGAGGGGYIKYINNVPYVFENSEFSTALNYTVYIANGAYRPMKITYNSIDYYVSENSDKQALESVITSQFGIEADATQTAENIFNRYILITGESRLAFPYLGEEMFAHFAYEFTYADGSITVNAPYADYLRNNLTLTFDGEEGIINCIITETVLGVSSKTITYSAVLKFSDVYSSENWTK